MVVGGGNFKSNGLVAVKSKKQPSICCIIPANNEDQRITSVLKVVSKIKLFEKIICVDDGSSDDTAKVVKEKFPEVKLISLGINKGKTSAVFRGIKGLTCDYVLLLDADIKNLKWKEIEKAIKLTLKNDVDMTILRNVQAPFLLKINRGDIIISGQRIVKRLDLNKLSKESPKNYELEVTLNQYMIDRKKPVCWFPFSAKHIYKQEKEGIVRGIWGEVKMYWEVLMGVGVVNYIYQVLFFCRKDIRGMVQSLHTTASDF